MDKTAYQEKSRSQQEAEVVRVKVLAGKVQQTNYTTAPNSQYRPFEASFGTSRFKEINDFLASLDKSEFDNYQSLKDPLLHICQKLLNWKIEVGSDRLWHELFVRFIQYRENGSAHIIKNAWEQVKKEQRIIDSARAVHKEHLNKILEDNPSMPHQDPAQWCALCDDFNEFDTLQEFGYPLQFDTIFGAYTPKSFDYGQSHTDSKLREEHQ